ncbi:MAG: HAMP domain-containing sensor histidine kinase [Bacteroidota bacterium]|nr:HAMP domain-containing sensor histidine kinase [Bacteroidota bacterium]
MSLDKSIDYAKLLAGLPRHLKSRREDVINDLQNLILNESNQTEYRDYLDALLDTLLVGRVGLAIQSLSHQFFTPLQGAMADLNNVESNVERDESIKRLRKNFDSLAKLATEVQLLLSSSEEFNPNMLRRVTVHSMITDIFQSLTSAATEKHINLQQRFNNFSRTVSAIPGQLHIVLSNIIQNAIKYSFKGYATAPLSVEISYEQDGDFLRINITNEGCKITDEEIREGLLFELGYRGEYSRDRQRKGTGSGLFICREIVKTHGGKILVKSDFCGGSIELKTDRYKNTFSILWPIFHDYS